MPAAEAGRAYRPLPQEMDLTDALWFEHWRKVARATQWSATEERYSWFLVRTGGATQEGTTVEVCDWLDGELSALYEEQEIATQEAPLRACVLWGSKQGPSAVTPEGGREGPSTLHGTRAGVLTGCSGAFYSNSGRGGRPKTGSAHASVLGCNPRGGEQRAHSTKKEPGD
jgi:hypothetical protein